MKNLFKFLFVFVIFTSLMSCEKSKQEIIIESNYYKSTLFDPLFDTLQKSYIPLNGAFYCTWNPETGTMDSIQNFIRISNDTVKWIEWNITRNELYETYQLPPEEDMARPTSYINYMIVDMEIEMPYYPQYFDIHGILQWDADSSGFIIYSGYFEFNYYYNYNGYEEYFVFYPYYPNQTILETEPTNNTPLFLENLNLIMPSMLIDTVETFPVEDLTNQFVTLDWNANQNLSWRLFIEKNGELVVDNLLVYTNTYDFYYNSAGSLDSRYSKCKFYVKGFNSFGITKMSNETKFEIVN